MNWKRILLYGLLLAVVLLAGMNYKFFAQQINDIGIGVPLLLLLVLLVLIINTIYQAHILKTLKSMQNYPEDDQ
jgi:uncharacterized membrane protein (DUF485 family)